MDAFKYWAFISYSSRDVNTAVALQRALELYRMPRSLVGKPGRDGPVPARVFPVFRDRDELPLSANLGDGIQAALRASRYLVVICSPHAAESRWVNEEVRYFKELGREDHILAIMVAGEPNASDVPGKETWECFPPALRHRLQADGTLSNERVEPIAGDLRPRGDGWDAVVLKAIAGMTGLGYDALVQREYRRVRRRRMVRSAVLGAMLMVLMVAGFLTWDHYYRVKVAFYKHVVSRWGVPEGVYGLSSDVVARRAQSYRIETNQGKVRRVVLQNSAAVLQEDPDHHGAARWDVEYGEKGEVVRVDYYDRHGWVVMRETYSPLEGPDPDGRRAATIRLEDRRGFSRAAVAQMANIAAEVADEPNLPVARSLIAAQRVTYNSSGFVTEAAYCDVQGTPVRKADGAFGQRFEVSALGLVERITNLGADGKPTAAAGGVASVVHGFDMFGNRNEVEYRNLQDQPVAGPDGFIGIVREYDPYGNVEHEFRQSRRVLPSAEPTLVGVRILRSPQGFPTKEVSIDVAGEAAARPDGVALIEREFDARGNLKAVCYRGRGEGSAAFSRAWPLVTGPEGYARLAQVIDEDEPVEAAYFAPDNKPIRNKLGYAKVKAKYDRGRVVEERYFNEQGVPAPGDDGFAMTKATYDEQRLNGEAYFDVDGKPVLRTGGFASYRINESSDGRIIEQAFFGLDGRPTVVRDGYAVVRQVYDYGGRPTKTSYLGLDGKLVPHRLGFARLTQEMDTQGRLVARTYVNGEGKLVRGFHGYASMRKVWHDNGLVKRKTYRGPNGELVEGPEGYADVSLEVDETGRPTELFWRGSDGKPIEGPSGYARGTWEYGSDGILKKQELRRADGSLLTLEVVVVGLSPPEGAMGQLQVGDVIRRYKGREVISSEQFTQLNGEGVRGEEELLIKRGQSQLRVKMDKGALIKVGQRLATSP